MKLLIVTIVTFLSFGALVFGKIHYDNKIASHAGQVVKEKVEMESTEVVTQEVEEQPEEEKDFSPFMKNLPEAIKTKINQAVTSGTPIKLVILGSKSTSSEEYGWPALVKQKLEDTYGVEIFDITIEEIKDKTSMEVISEELHQSVVDSEPGILLYEPFILTDNGKVRMEDRLENLTTIIDEFKTSNPDVYVLLQPAHPLYNATFYPREVNELKSYAETNEITYLDHWSAWPEQTSTDLLNYLSADRSEPNEEGHKLWAEFLMDYFVSE